MYISGPPSCWRCRSPLRAAGPALTEDQLFAALDLSRPGLEPVAAALKSNDRAAARHALAEYYRHRTKPVYTVAPGEKSHPKHPDTSRAERAMRHDFESIGYRHSFGATIDWHFDQDRRARQQTRAEQ